MGRISVEYKKKPTPLEALKMDMSLEILDHNIEKIPGDVIFHINNKYSELQSYVIYAACKHQDQVIAIISLIDYDVKSKKVYIKIMDDTSGPYYYNMSKSVFDKLTPLKEQSYAQKWRDQVQSNFNKYQQQEVA